MTGNVCGTQGQASFGYMTIMWTNESVSEARRISFHFIGSFKMF